MLGPVDLVIYRCIFQLRTPQPLSAFTYNLITTPKTTHLHLEIQEFLTLQSYENIL